jgi:hypothetical protein
MEEKFVYFYRNMIDHAGKEHDLRREDLTPKLKEQIMNLINLIEILRS